MARFPGAVWLGNGVSGGSVLAGKPKIVFHTTETAGLPGYREGQSAPHFTYDHRTKTTYQHTDTSVASRALQNRAGGVQTNRAGHVIQVEIVAYSNRALAAQYPQTRRWVGHLDDNDYERLARIWRWAHKTHEVPFWMRLPRVNPTGGVGVGPPRMSPAEWTGFSGACGHFEVPENDPKWDPGAFDFVRLLGKALPAPPIPPDPPEPPDPPHPPVPPTRLRRYMFPLTDRAHYIETISLAEVFGMIDAGVVGLIDGDVERTKAYYTEVFAEPRNPDRPDWDNLIAASVRAHWTRS